MRILRIPSAYFLELKIMVKNRLFCNMVFRMQAVAVEKVLLRAHTHKCRGAGSILRRRGQLPEKGTFSMTNIRIITKKASLTFPILSLRGGGGGFLNMFEGRGTCQFFRVSFSKKCRNYQYQFLKYVQN